MFSGQVNQQVRSIAIAGCAVASQAVCGIDYAPEWEPDPTCSDFQNIIKKCAIADIAVAGYAYASWDYCACSSKGWVTMVPVTYASPYLTCDDDELQGNTF